MARNKLKQIHQTKWNTKEMKVTALAIRGRAFRLISFLPPFKPVFTFGVAC